MSSDPWGWQPSGPSRTEQAGYLIRLDGPDSGRFLHGQTSSAIEGQQPGSWIPSCCTTATGRLRALAEVLVDRDGAWLLLRGADGTALWQALERVLFPADRVQLGPVTPVRLITPLGDGCDALPQVADGSWISLEDGSGWLLGRQLVLLTNAELPAWLADRAPLPAREQQRWRIQQGVPEAPGEINDDTNPFEVGLADRVSLSKGCYVGQETLAKLATYDGVKQQLRRWFWRGTQDPGEPGTVLTGGEPSSPRAGLITSSLALEDGLWIGLALVRRQSLQQTCLRAGPDPDGALLELSRPPACVDPPVGAGRKS
ncbi:folate-binding protein [Cyanobium sp. BA5m-21]|uniref:CAF17-like 4Fe-4S cluster assembly/insertion protein YgfZ n=1 Tax=unclassified Cyanobium TaxID=2627006 RepID=UPI0020CF779C|nr:MULTISPECIES: folate-binding protein [unclassified Cyanobium]MCP9903418.1 folate-binding protein [Cyanobium sp. BA5m-10]MCP9906847.1 folate-binding protein [Cyanobium sp. BA5m-21]MCP9914371.1 folate-binding protein [Cyanobium sp. BA20m-14]